MPASPSPARRRRVPLSTPGGIFTESVCWLSTRPWPRHEVQRSRTTSPAPPQASHGRLMRKKPCWNMSWPVPRQREQLSGWVPARAPEPLQLPHGRIFGIVMRASLPSSTSASSRSSW
jgi:hypothetical protein